MAATSVVLGVLVKAAVLGAVLAVSSQCDGDEASCTASELPRSGSAMLQVSADKISADKDEKKAKVPLTLRLTNLENEVGSLQQRTSSLQETIMGGGGGGGGGEALLQKGKKDGTVKERTANLEADVGTLKSQISTLENQVSGNGMAFVEIEKNQNQKKDQKDASLKARIAALEKEVATCRTRVTTLEQKAVG